MNYCNHTNPVFYRHNSCPTIFEGGIYMLASNTVQFSPQVMNLVTLFSHPRLTHLTLEPAISPF